ncbi:MAG TPA: HYR domain-containing protein [Thermoanaerobaculia bacterium]|nr:HYR domain-containing protein [Thermoanaerobaculia bacterium]
MRAALGALLLAFSASAFSVTSFTVSASEVLDQTPPVLHLPADITAKTGTLPFSAYVSFHVTAEDAVDPNPKVSCMPGPGFFPVGTTTVGCSAVDFSNNSAYGEFRITVIETPPPIIQIPPDMTVPATSPDGAIVKYTAKNVTCYPSSGSLFPIGTTEVDCTMGDMGGFFHVTVLPFDQHAYLILPDDITVTATVESGAPVTFTASASNGAAVTCAPPSGSLFPIGTTTVNCSAGTLTGSFHVTVTPFNDNAHLILPDDVTVAATGPGGAVVTFTASASNGAPVTCTPSSGSLFPAGTTTVNCTAGTLSGTFHVTVTPFIAPLPDITAEAASASGAYVHYDVSGCSPASDSLFPLGSTLVSCTAGTFHVIVVDTTPPVIVNISVDPSVLRPPDHKMQEVTVTVNAMDTVSSPVMSRIVNVTANETIDDDWQITGPLTASLRAERSGENNERIYTLEIECTDAAGNIATGTVQVRVPHDNGNNDGSVIPSAPRGRRPGPRG